MRFILSSIGSMGDVLPFVEVARTLRQRGHETILLANGHFQPLAAKNGIEFHALGTSEEYLKLAQSEDAYHPLRGVKITAEQWILPYMHKTLDYLRAYRDSRDTVLVGTIATLGLRMANELYKLPMHSLVLSPFILPSLHLTPISPGFSLPAWSPRPLKTLFQSIVNRGLDDVLKPGINKLRSELKMSPLASSVRSWWLSPKSIICTFPEWFAPVQPDWPDVVRMTNFIAPSAQNGELSPDLQEFLARDGRMAVVTTGSILSGTQAPFQVMLKAFLDAKFRVVLLSGNQSLTSSSPQVKQVSFAPLATVLAHANVVVHHAGIGTGSSAILAGVPQLLIPHGHDQFDNAARFERLGVAKVIRPGKSSFGPGEIETFLGSGEVAAACARLKARYGSSSPGVEQVRHLLESRV
jgi:rhamnosyltransferase subunit B